MNAATMRVWRALADHAKQHSYSPSYRELGATCAIKSVSQVKACLDTLQAERVIARGGGRARNIDLLRQPPREKEIA